MTHHLLWPFVLEDALLLLAVVIFAETALLWWRSRGWSRVGWILLALVWGYLVFGEVWLAITGSEVFIWRWTRAIPARLGTALAFGIFVASRWGR